MQLKNRRLLCQLLIVGFRLLPAIAAGVPPAAAAMALFHAIART
jgi:hypothetical protein